MWSHRSRAFLEIPKFPTLLWVHEGSGKDPNWVKKGSGGCITLIHTISAIIILIPLHESVCYYLGIWKAIGQQITLSGHLMTYKYRTLSGQPSYMWMENQLLRFLTEFSLSWSVIAGVFAMLWFGDIIRMLDYSWFTYYLWWMNKNNVMTQS